MGVGLLQVVIDFLEVLPGDSALADDSLPAPSDGLFELAFVAAEHQGQAVLEVSGVCLFDCGDSRGRRERYFLFLVAKALCGQ